MARHGQQQQQVVVVTGASGGIGRATAIAFGARGAARGPAGPRGAAASQGAAKEVQAAGGRALVVPVDVADAEAVERAAATVEEQLGPIDVWVNVAFSSVFAPFWEIGAKEFAPRDRGQLPRLRLRHDGRPVAGCARATAATIVQVGSALAYRGIPLQTAYCGVQARHPGLPRGAALRAAARAQRRARDHGPDAGGQHPAVLLAAVPAAAPGAAGAARSTSPRSPPRASCTPPTTRGDGSTGSAAARWAPWPPTPSRRGCWTATSPGPASPPSRPTSRRTPTSRPTCGSRSTGDGRTSAPTGASTTGRPPRSVQLWASQHHGLLGAAAGAAAAGTALLTRAVRR